MWKKIKAFFRGQIFISMFFIALGACLVLMPEETVNVLCKVVFVVLMIVAGLYHIFVFLRENREDGTVLDLFSGVIVLVVGGFLFTNPQIVIKLLPIMLGAFVLVDCVWTLRGSFRLKKRKLEIWKLFPIESVIFLGFGILLVVNPFQTVSTMLTLAGWVFLCNGVLDIILYIILYRGMKKEIPESNETEAQDIADQTRNSIPAVSEESVSETSTPETTSVSEETESWKNDKAETTDEENMSVDTAETKPADQPVEETLEEWND